MPLSGVLFFISDTREVAKVVMLLVRVHHHAKPVDILFCNYNKVLPRSFSLSLILPRRVAHNTKVVPRPKCKIPRCSKPIMAACAVCLDHYAEDLYTEVTTLRHGNSKLLNNINIADGKASPMTSVSAGIMR